jgi:hypothetical protein
MSNLDRSIVLLSLALIGGWRPISTDPRTLRIGVYDYAGLSEAALHQFLAATQRILADGRLAVQLTPCRTQPAGNCRDHTRVWESLEIRILPGHAPIVKNRGPILGQAFVGPERGIYATVFLAAVHDQALAAGVPWVVVLAYAAAHEVGHLLLGSAQTPRGLMKANWDRRDYEAMNQNACHFDEKQSRQLARFQIR